LGAFQAVWAPEPQNSCRAGKGAAEEITQVEAGGAAGEPGGVLGGAAVAQFQAAAAGAGDLGDGEHERATE